MAPLKVLASRFRASLRSSELDRDFDLELESHLAMLADDNVRRGMTAAAARREARISLGALEATRELHREARGLPAVAALLQDLRYTGRTLRRDAGLAVFAILTVGLGIGASATIFSVVNALLLRPLPFRDPGRLVWIANSEIDSPSESTIQVGHFVDLRERNRSLSELAAFYAFYSAGNSKLTGDGAPERLSAVPVTCNFFFFPRRLAAARQSVHRRRMQGPVALPASRAVERRPLEEALRRRSRNRRPEGHDR